jgi:hypothetical protein
MVQTHRPEVPGRFRCIGKFNSSILNIHGVAKLRLLVMVTTSLRVAGFPEHKEYNKSS